MIEQIRQEIKSYENHSVERLDGHSYSAYKTIRRISLYQNQIYPTGKTDSQGNYKYWYDIITPRRNSEVKNIDFDTKDVSLESDGGDDAGKLIISNIALKDWLKTSGQADKLNDAVEKGADWGSVVFKKVSGSYRVMDLTHFFVLNTLAETLADSDVIEEETMYPADLRAKMGVWKNVQDLMDSAKTKDKGSPEYFVYERNGEVSEKDLYKEQGKDGGDEKKYVLAKIIAGGAEKGQPSLILYAETLTKKPYKEYHRTAYQGRWLRVGVYETLLDCQTRANEIGNQIARGLEYAAKTVFRSSDRVIAQNILTDLQNGDIIKSTDLQQVQTRMDGFDQLIADWNRIVQLADALTNSYEVVTGANLPSGTPFSLGALQNANAGKLFDFIREKLGNALTDVIDDWIKPEMLRDLKGKRIIEITGDSGVLNRYYKLLVDNWYIENLVNLPPHSTEIAESIKGEKLKELQRNKSIRVQLEEGMWDNFKPRAKVVITGENFNLAAENEKYKSFIQLEQDPIRRTALIEIAMAKNQIDVSGLPKTEVQPVEAQPKAQPTLQTA